MLVFTHILHIKHVLGLLDAGKNHIKCVDFFIIFRYVPATKVTYKHLKMAEKSYSAMMYQYNLFGYTTVRHVGMIWIHLG